MKSLTLLVSVSLAVFASGTASAQSWNITYAGDYVPGATPAAGEDLQVRDAGNPFDPVVQSNDGAQVPAGSPSYLHFEDSVSAQDQKWDEADPAPSTELDESFAAGGTMVMRIRRVVGAVGVGNVRCVDIRSSVGDRCSIQVGRDNGVFIESVNGGGGAINIGNISDWHVYRFTFTPEGGAFRIRAYVDGNTTAATDTVTAWNTTDNQWKLGSGSFETGEYDLDWLLVTDDGAFPPGSGPLLPPDFDEGYIGPWEPTWTPGPTPTPKPPGVVTNGDFETGDLTGWTRYYAVSCKNLNTPPHFQVRSDPCDVWIPSVCYVEGTHHLRLQDTIAEVGALDGVMQVITGLDPSRTYTLEMSGMLRSQLPGDDYLRLWWLPRAFTETIPTPQSLCNPANFPVGEATLIGEWTQETGQPAENWVTMSGPVNAPIGEGTIFIDAQFDDADWGTAIVAAYVDAVRLIAGPAPPTPSTGLERAWQEYR